MKIIFDVRRPIIVEDEQQHFATVLNIKGTIEYFYKKYGEDLSVKISNAFPTIREVKEIYDISHSYFIPIEIEFDNKEMFQWKFYLSTKVLNVVVGLS